MDIWYLFSPRIECITYDIEHNPVAANFQPILYPSNSLPFKFISLQFRDKDVLWDPVKSLAEVEVDDIYHSSLDN